jgi:dTDP-4-amino-4,6-dideoxygalactose transaminase
MHAGATLATSEAPGAFVVPREPRLRASMLLRGGRRPSDWSPVPGSVSVALCSGRNAMYHGVRLVGIRPGDRVLVPAYHCSALVEPIRRYGAVLEFYRIGRGCEADIADIRRRLTPETRGLVAIHYFGFPQPIAKLRALCDEHGLALIEDCAHVLAGRAAGRPLGAFGDASIFSWWKFLPVNDGGQLVINRRRAEVPLPALRMPSMLRLRAWKDALDRLMADSPSAGVRTVTGPLRAALKAGRRLARHAVRDTPGRGTDNPGPDFDLESVMVPMSAVSQRVLRNADFSAITAARRSNYVALLRACERLPGLEPLFPELPEGICPWIFPVTARGWSGFHLELRARGIPAVTWGGVIHPNLALEDFPDAAYLYDNLVFLPIHQDLDGAALTTMTGTIATLLGDRR